MIIAARVTVGAAATLLTPAQADAVFGSRLFIKNTHATETLLIGGPTVTAATGFALAPGERIDLELNDGEPAYGLRGAAVDVVAHVLAMK